MRQLWIWAVAGLAPVVAPMIVGAPALADPLYTLTLQDVGLGISSTQSALGGVNFNGSFGNFSIANLSASGLNPAVPFDMGLDSRDTFTGTGSDTLNVFVTVSNLTAPVPSLLTIGTAASANFEGSYINGWRTSTYVDPANQTGLAGMVDLLSRLSAGTTANSFDASTSGSMPLANTPFSYTIEYSLDFLTGEFAEGAGATTNVSLTSIGEPASFAILGIAALGFMLAFKRRGYVAFGE
jgi:hypothetical protein